MKDDTQSMYYVVEPVEMLSGLSQDPELAPIAAEVEAKTMQMVDDAK